MNQSMPLFAPPKSHASHDDLPFWQEVQCRTPLEQPPFLPMSKADMLALGWDELDILLVSGDAYVDHPTFAVALLGRLLVAHGFRTGIIAQPNHSDPASVTVMGRPKLFAGVSAGAIDSMLAHYTAFRKIRRDDAYTPGGKAGKRPDRAVTVYSQLLRKAFPNLWILAGGIEASLRRAVHYDFWSKSIRPSLLVEASPDLIIYGMGERALVEAARRVDVLVETIGQDSTWWPTPATVWGDILGTAHMALQGTVFPQKAVPMPSWHEIAQNPKALLQAAVLMEKENHLGLRCLVQPHGADGTLIVQPPAQRLTTVEMDALYDLPFSRLPHPGYTKPIPAADMIVNSITTHRGCGGGCSFCSLALHQGRRIASRSRASILREAQRMAASHTFNGSISDIGGPSANMWGTQCQLPENKACTRTSCLFPKICTHFAAKQDACVQLLRDVQALEGIKHVRVASGVRFDMALCNGKALEAYAGEFTGGQLKIAPEHISAEVLQLMRKPSMAAFDAFLAAFVNYSRAHGKEQYVIPYLMSAFPGCTNEHMRELAHWLYKRHWSPKQVQAFIPTPGTVATAMFHAQTAPDGRPLYVAKSDAERRKQHDILLNRTEIKPPKQNRNRRT